MFWVAVPYAFVGRYRRFEGTYCLHLEGCYYAMVLLCIPAATVKIFSADGFSVYADFIKFGSLNR